MRGLCCLCIGVAVRKALHQISREIKSAFRFLCKNLVLDRAFGAWIRDFQEVEVGLGLLLALLQTFGANLRDTHRVSI